MEYLHACKTYSAKTLTEALEKCQTDLDNVVSKLGIFVDVWTAVSNQTVTESLKKGLRNSLYFSFIRTCMQLNASSRHRLLNAALPRQVYLLFLYFRV